MKHRITLTRQQRVDADAGFLGQLFEAGPFPFMGDKDLPLLRRHLLERFLYLVQQNAACIGGFRPFVQRRQQVFERNSRFVILAIFGLIERLQFAAAKTVDDAVLRDPE